MSFRKYLVLAAIIFFGSLGDISLSYGMKKLGPLSAARWTEAVAAVFSPWVALGILLLLGFFASYLTALSWADLSYVLPACSVGYVVLALLSMFLLHEHVSLTRWIGILLVSSGVGIITRGPSLTTPRQQGPAEEMAPASAVRR